MQFHHVPCGTIFGGAFIPTEKGLIYMHIICNHDHIGQNLYELRGDTVATLKWIKVDQQLTQQDDDYPIGFPLPDKVNITCQ